MTSLALDPVEKKPLYHFHPGSFILSAGSFGCNMRCPFCQNYQISQADSSTHYRKIMPEELVSLALKLKNESLGNIGVAFTYNEPLVSYEYILDTSRLLHESDLLCVLVTNGQICREPLRELLPHIDAMNIDLKAFSADFYRYAGGDFQTTLDCIKTAAAQCHIEITTLIIPGKNDSSEEMELEARFIAGISKDIPLHLTRFFPRYKETQLSPTPVESLTTLAAVASRYLKHVHLGNV